MESLFCHIYDFHNPVQNAAPVSVSANLPPRYAINFIPASVISDFSASNVAPAFDHSAVPAHSAIAAPSVAAVPAYSVIPALLMISLLSPPITSSMFTFTPCIDTTQ